MNFNPLSYKELLDTFHSSTNSTAKHLLIIYSLVVATNSKKIIDMGLGMTTRILKLAALKTGGVVYSCDCDIKRFNYLLDQQDQSWQLQLCSSEKFIQSITPPFDFVMHDAAHDYYQVKMDLEMILPKMKTFGLICVHDTQQPDLGHEMLAAICDAAQGHLISIVNLPFYAGMAIIRVEAGDQPQITPLEGGTLKDGRSETELLPLPLGIHRGGCFEQVNNSYGRWLRWRLRKLVKGY